MIGESTCRHGREPALEIRGHAALLRVLEEVKAVVDGGGRERMIWDQDGLHLASRNPPGATTTHMPDPACAVAALWDGREERQGVMSGLRSEQEGKKRNIEQKDPDCAMQIAPSRLR